MNKFDPDKPVKQRNGRAARIICTDARGEKPIVALIDYSTAFGCEDEPWLYYSDGRCELGGTSQYDLLNIEEPKLQLPITPGRYRMRSGEVAVIQNDSVDSPNFPISGIIKGEHKDSYITLYWKSSGRYSSIEESQLDLVERLPDIHLDTIRSEEKKKVIAAKYEGMPPYDEEELRKTSFHGHGEKIMKEVQLETINSKLDELLRRVG